MIGYWALPAEPARAWLVSCIANLSREYDGPIFEPHVTLHSADDDDTLATTLLHRAAANRQPIEVGVESVRYSGAFTKTLFVQLTRTEALDDLALAVRDASADRDLARFEPHVSLLYAPISAEAKADEAARIEVPFRTITLDAIQAVRFTPPIATRGDVEAWRAISKTQLGR